MTTVSIDTLLSTEQALHRYNLLAKKAKETDGGITPNRENSRAQGIEILFGRYY